MKDDEYPTVIELISWEKELSAGGLKNTGKAEILFLLAWGFLLNFADRINKQVFRKQKTLPGAGEKRKEHYPLQI